MDRLHRIGRRASPNVGDATGLVTQKLYADGQGPCYTDIDDGNFATRTWARGVTTSYTYDAWGSITSTTYSDGTPSVTFAYDALGRRTSVTDAKGTTAFSYDAFGDESQEAVTGLYAKTLVRMRERRHFRTDWCYHLISRIAHRAFFLTEDERTRFVDLLRRVSDFSGVEVLGVPLNCARHSGSGARTSSRRATCRRWKRPVSSGSSARRTASRPISCSS